MPKKQPAYNASSIRVLKGLEAVRERPGMYIGDTDNGDGYHHMLWEVLDNAIDEAMAGYARNIIVEIGDGWASVEDDGRGIPVGPHPEGRDALEIVMTVLHAGGKFNQKETGASSGLHGVGVSVVNALSENLVVTVWREGKTFSQRYQRGAPTSEVVKSKGVKGKTGTRTVFFPDPSVFSNVTTFNPKRVLKRLEDMAYLNAGLRLVFRQGDFEQVCQFDGGIKDLVAKIAQGLEPIGQPIYLRGVKGEIRVEAAMVWTRELQREHLSAYTNTVLNGDGGTHVSGYRSGVTGVITSYANEDSIRGADHITGDDVRESLVSVISITMPDPKFSSQTKDKLVSSEARGVVEEVVSEGLRNYLELSPALRAEILGVVIRASRARKAAKEARETERKGKQSESTPNPLAGKLAECQSKNLDENEIFLVEGESAGGSAKQGRDRKFQAIMPLRGKVLNVEGEPTINIAQHNELLSLSIALGTGFGHRFDMSKLRYGKVIIMTDADVDGSHIRCLLLTFFYRQMLPLMLAGRVYVARPPLYGAIVGKKRIFLRDDREKDEFVARYPKTHIQRYKGLGEMTPQQLWDTTMDPSKRLLQRVDIGDHLQTNALMDDLMGSMVKPRLAFIQRNSQLARLDL